MSQVIRSHVWGGVSEYQSMSAYGEGILGPNIHTTVCIFMLRCCHEIYCIAWYVDSEDQNISYSFAHILTFSCSHVPMRTCSHAAMLSWNLLHCVVCIFIAWYVYLHTTQCSRFHYNIAAWEHVLIGISEHENVRIWAKSYDAMCGGGLRMLNHQKIENRRCSRSHGTPYIAHDTCHTIHATPCRAHHTLHTIHSTRYMPHHAEHHRKHTTQ